MEKITKNRKLIRLRRIRFNKPILLSEEMHRKLKAYSFNYEIPMAEILHLILEKFLTKETVEQILRENKLINQSIN